MELYIFDLHPILSALSGPTCLMDFLAIIYSMKIANNTFLLVL